MENLDIYGWVNDDFNPDKYKKMDEWLKKG